MSFKCEVCNKQTKKKEKMTKIVVETRRKQYKEGTTGTETVKEKAACAKCSEQ